MTTLGKYILAISGSGRSGTTILSVLLGQNENTLNLGQSRDFWRAFADNRECTCSEALQACPLWSEIVKTAFPDWSEEDFLGMSKKMRLFIKAAEQHSDWSNPAFLKDISSAHSEYIAAVRLFIAACFSVSGTSTLIDTSKSPEIALSFQLADAADVFVLNLVRDPRAVACSWATKGVSGKTLDARIDAWKARQIRLENWAEVPGLKHLKLDYHRFTQHPDIEISRVLEWASPAGRLENPLTFDHSKCTEVSWARMHLFPPANEKVLAEKKTQVAVKEPRAWRSAKQWPLHIRVLRRTHPEGMKYILGR